MLDTIEIEKRMQNILFSGKIQCLEEVDSTSTRLKVMAENGAPEGTALFAVRQSAGRGRLGRRFQSPQQGGIYMSVLLRPSVALEDIALLTPCTGVCVARTVEAVCGLSPKVKWVNDVLLEGKKICGILTETVVGSGGMPQWVVIGVGINVNTDIRAFSPEVRDVATSLCCHTQQPVDEMTLAAHLLDQLAALYHAFPAQLEAYHAQYRERLVTLGQMVSVLGEEEESLEVLDLDARFGLVVRNGVGEVRTLRSGEVSVRPVVASSTRRD